MTITATRIVLDAGTELFEFTGSQIAEAKIITENNPVSVELPISTIEFKVINTAFTPFSDAIKLLSERLPVSVYESVDGNEQFMGEFFLEDWKNVSEEEFAFIATDLIGILEKTEFDGIFWSSQITLSAALSQTLGAIGIDYDLEASIENNLVSGWIPPGNYREALKQICFAAGAAVYTNRRNDIRVEAIALPYQESYTLLVDNSEKLEGHTLDTLPIVTGIELVSHNYSQGAGIETIYEETLAAGEHKVVFGKPYYSIVIDGPGFASSTLALENNDDFVLEDGDFIEVAGEYLTAVNSVTFVLTTPGTVTITGYPWIDSKRSFLFTEDGITESSKKNNLIIEDATLISVNNAQTILDLLRDYYRNRYLQTLTLLPTVAKPKDLMLAETLYSAMMLTTIEKIEFDLTGGFLAKIVAIGLEVVFVRRAVTGIAAAGSDLTWQSRFRRTIVEA